MLDPAVDRAWRAAADVRRRLTGGGSRRSALRSLGRPSRRDPDRWERATSQHHARYRAEHPPASDRAAVVCVSRRPHLLDRVVTNIARQRDEIELDVVFVTNHRDFALLDVERELTRVGGATIIETDPSTTLGAALNLGFDATSERYVAKLDDDDWYGAGYLADGLRAHGYAGAGVVGKHTYYADVGSPPARYLRFPGHEFEYSGTLAGGTLIVDRDLVGSIAFEDLSLGEDRAFLAACHRRGISTFSADRFGFVQHRDRDNTWSIAAADFLAGCRPVDRTAPEHAVDRPPAGDDR